MKILIAEDDPVSRRLMEALLSKWGYEPVSAADGQSAWDSLQAEDAPNLVISDWMMPAMDGLELCRRVRSMNRSGYIYLIIVTAKGRKRDLFDAFEAGADDYLIKPFDHQELRYRVRNGRRIIQLERRILELTRIDPLTGVLNRRAFTEKLRSEIQRAVRQRTRLSLIMADIDHFKRINDLYGHQAGDRVLKILCRELRKVIRSYDFLGRYGGEEFMVCLPGASKEQAGHIAERMRLAAERITADEAGVEEGFRITISLGVSTSREAPIQTMEGLIGMADDALYKAKAQGRNRVCAAREEPPARDLPGEGG